MNNIMSIQLNRVCNISFLPVVTYMINKFKLIPYIPIFFGLKNQIGEYRKIQAVLF